MRPILRIRGLESGGEDTGNTITIRDDPYNEGDMYRLPKDALSV